MDQLPVELITLVCSFLKPRDIGHLRRASKLYADVCRPSMFREEHLMFTPASFEHLQAISSDPKIAAYVTSFFYEADTLPFFDSKDEWELHLTDRAYTSAIESLPPLDPTSSDRTRRAYQREYKRLWRRPRHQYSRLQVTTAYQKYLDYSTEQDDMRRDKYHAGKIADALAKLPNLQEIILSLECWRHERSEALKDAYKDCYTVAHGDNSWTEPLGVPQMLSLLLGSARTRMNLKRLSCGLVEWWIFRQDDKVFEELKKAVRNLQELTLELSTGIKDSLEGHEIRGGEIETCAEYLKNGRVLDFLAAAPKLRMLDFRFDLCNPNCAADLRYVVGRHKWEFLADVTLSTLEGRAEDLLGFCETHATTLRQLVLDEIKLVEGSWSATFQKMRQLLNLKKVRICGSLEAFEFQEVWTFSEIEFGDETMLSQVVEKYLLEGGEGPLLDLDEYDGLTELEYEELVG